ncbi:MAG: ABC transporter substrate-binding protein, partial [Pseudomonadota bacterium]
MSVLSRFCLAAALAVSATASAQAQEGSLSIAVGFGPTAEVPDPRAGYNGWMSNQTGVTETLMGIDYEMNLYPRLAE